jgi:hypothetical protein
MVATAIDVWNLALRQIGSRRLVATPYEGTDAALACLDCYSAVRDAATRAGDWSFARKANVALVAIKGPPPPGGYNPGQPWGPSFPALPWLYEYAYPADCLRFGAVLPPPGLLPDLDPRPALWRDDTDGFDGNGAALPVPVRVILTNIPGALGVYWSRATNPLFWPPDFLSTVVDSLAARLSVMLAGSADLLKDERQAAVAVGAATELVRG